MIPLVVLVGVAVMAPNQQDPFAEAVIVKATRLEVREALRRFIKPVQAYSVNPDVQGEVTVDLHGVTLNEVFQDILYQVNADYRSGGGVLQIFKKESNSVGEISFTHLPSYDVKHSDLVWVFGKTFQKLGVRGILYPEARGLISYTGHPNSVQQLLGSLTAKSGTVYRTTPQGYEVLRASPVTPLLKFISNLPYSQAQAFLDGNVKFVVERDLLSKVTRPKDELLGKVLLRPQFRATALDLNSDWDRRRLQELANLADCTLVIAPEIRSVVHIESGPATVEHLKICLARSLNTTLEAGLILVPLNGYTFLSAFDFQPVGEHTFPGSALRRVGEGLQVDSGRWRYLVRPGDLSIVDVKPRS